MTTAALRTEDIKKYNKNVMNRILVFFVKERHVYSNTKVLTGSYSPHYFPGIHGAGGVIVRG